MGMQQGALNLLIPNPRDIPGLVKELQKQPFHFFPGLNTLFNALLNNAEFRKLDFSPLVLTMGGGMAVQKGVAERWQELTKVNITEGYGLSETSPVATANLVTSTSFTGTIGLPIPSTDIAIRDDAGNDVALGRGRRDLHPRPAGHGGLLEPAGRDGQGHDRRRLSSSPETWAS